MGRWTPHIVGLLAGLVLGLAVLLVLVLGRGAPAPGGGAGPATERAATGPARGGDLSRPAQNSIVDAARRLGPAVVTVNAVRYQRRIGANDWTSQEVPQRVGQASGILVDHRGYVLTNLHVVNGAQEIVVDLGDGRQLQAERIGASARHDLVVLKIRGELSGLPVAPLGDSDEVQVGQWAIAIGSPLRSVLADATPTVTVGVISAVHRDVAVGAPDERYYDMIQTDAAINPGNSGGPLVDTEGRVIGINSYILNDSAGGSPSGMGFAVPVNRAKWVLREILEHGRVRTPWAGIDIELITRPVRVEQRLGSEVPEGCLVVSVVKDSPADRAGLRPRDVLTRIGDQPLTSEQGWNRAVYDAHVGAEFELVIWRDGQLFQTTVVLEEQPGRS